MRQNLSITITLAFGPADDIPNGMNPEILRFEIQTRLVDAIKQYIPLGSNLRGIPGDVIVTMGEVDV